MTVERRRHSRQPLHFGVMREAYPFPLENCEPGNFGTTRRDEALVRIRTERFFLKTFIGTISSFP